MNKITKNQFLKWFAITVIVLALVRLIFPSVARSGLTEEQTEEAKAEKTEEAKAEQTEKVKTLESPDSVLRQDSATVEARELDDIVRDQLVAAMAHSTSFTDAQGRLAYHPIMGVHSYKEAFPDSNDVQLTAAQRYGVEPVASRDEAEQLKNELVYVGANPYFHVDPLRQSIPYLVPRAAILLQDIGRNFFDSLQVKRIPLHKIIVSSVLRTEDDVRKLKDRNRNATENSCHLYGTTFDLCYNRYKTVADPLGPPRREVQNDTLKWVLSEVLADLRRADRCYVKYEVKQGCFHITVR